MLLGTRRGGRSPCSETLANDHLLLRKREERSFGVIAVGNVVLFNSNELRNTVGMSCEDSPVEATLYNFNTISYYSVLNYY